MTFDILLETHIGQPRLDTADESLGGKKSGDVLGNCGSLERLRIKHHYLPYIGLDPYKKPVDTES